VDFLAAVKKQLSFMKGSINGAKYGEKEYKDV
jgi:hypothetical protein